MGGLRRFEEEYIFFKELYPNSKYLSILEKDRINNEAAYISMNQASPIEEIEKVKYQYFEQWIPIILDNSHRDSKMTSFDL